MSLKLLQISRWKKGLQSFQRPVLGCSPWSLGSLRSCQVAVSEGSASRSTGRERHMHGQDHFMTQQRLQYEINNQKNIMLTFEYLLSQYNPKKGLSPAFYNVIKNCSHPSLLETPADKIALATTIITEMKNKGIKLNVSIYNTLLRTYLTLNHTLTPSDLLADMQDNGVSPNLGTLSYLIRAYCQQGNLTGAAKLLEHMKQNNLPISEDVYASLITGHAVNKDLSSATGVLTLMKEKGHLPSNLTYQALLCAHAQYGDFQEIVDVREKMRYENVFASTSSLIKVMDTLSLHNHGQVIPEVLDLVRNKQWILEDLRSLACVLAMRGEVDNTVLIIDCLAGYNAVNSRVGQALVRGMVANNNSLDEILEKISWLRSEINLVHIFGPYRDLLNCLFNGKISGEDGIAKDAVSVVTSMMNDCGVDFVMLYPVLAHHANTGNIEGCLDTLDLMAKCDNRYDKISMEYLTLTLAKAGVAPVVFCETNPRVIKRLLKQLLVFYSETGDFKTMAEILNGACNFEEVFTSNIFKRISISMRQNYRAGKLPELAEVFKGLNKLEPKPSLDKTIAIATFRVLWGGSNKDKADIFETLLKPLLEAEISIGESPNILLSHLARTKQRERFITLYKKFCDSPNVQLAQSIHDYAYCIENKKFDKLSEINLPPLRPLSFDLTEYNASLSEGKMPDYFGCEQLLLQLVKPDINSALKIKQDMLDHGYRLNLTVYTRLIQHYASQGDIKNLQEELGAVNAAGYKLNTPIYTAMMQCYAMKAETGEVVRVLEEVKAQSWPVTSHMTSHLVTAYLDSNDVKGALEAVREYRDSCPPLPHVLIKLFNVLIKQGHPHDDTQPIFDALKTQKFGTINIQDVELETYLENARFDLAEQLIKRPGFELNAGSFVSRCRQWVGTKKDRVEFAVKQLREIEIHKRNSGSALAMLKAYKLLMNREDVRTLYEDLIANDCVLDSRGMSIVNSMVTLSPDGTPVEDTATVEDSPTVDLDSLTLEETNK